MMREPRGVRGCLNGPPPGPWCRPRGWVAPAGARRPGWPCRPAHRRECAPCCRQCTRCLASAVRVGETNLHGETRRSFPRFGSCSAACSKAGQGRFRQGTVHGAKVQVSREGAPGSLLRRGFLRTTSGRASQCVRTAMRLPMVPEGTNSPASFPVTLAICGRSSQAESVSINPLQVLSESRRLSSSSIIKRDMPRGVFDARSRR